MAVEAAATAAASAAARALTDVEKATVEQMLEALRENPGQGASQYADWAKEMQFRRSAGAPPEAYGSYTPQYRWDYTPDGQSSLNRPVNQAEADAAWEAWKNSGGDVSSNGSATKAPKTSASPQTAIKKAGAGSATVGGLLSMSLPTWVAAAAPLLGVAVGVGLYELSPEFWEKVSRKLLPFCYEDSQAMPVVTDEDGNTYIDKEAVEALKEVFQEEGIPMTGSEEGYDSDLDTFLDKPIPYGISELVYKVNQTTITVTLYDAVVSLNGSSGYHYMSASAEPGEKVIGQRITYVDGTPTSVEDITANPNKTYTHDGKTVYYEQGDWSIYLGQLQSSTGAIVNKDTRSATGPDAWTVIYGTPTSSGEYKPGTSQWTGQAVDVGTLPVTQVYTDPEDETKTRDYIPVALPTEPGQSLDPETNPDPTQNEDPEAQISPYIMPTIPADQYPEGSESEDEEGKELDKNAPIPVPFPDPDSTPDTQANPNEQPEQPPQRLVDIIPPIDSGNITKPNMPGIGDPTNVDGGVGGLVSVYNPTYSELQAFSQWLWVTYADATIDKIWNNPFDGVISLHELYATPNKGARKNIKSGFLVSPVSSITIPNRYSEINCGTAIFPEYWGNYLDYSPYSKALCYLPFIGIVELNVDDIVGHTVNITYRVDSYSGACIALITCAREGSNAVLYQFSGNCSVQMPIAGGTQAAIKAAQISAGAYQNAYHTAGLAGLMGGMLGGLGSLLTGHIGSAISQAVGGIGSYATNQAFGQANATSQTVSAKSSVQHSGQFGESFGAMGAKRPYMIIKRPVQVVVPNYQNEYGYQAHKYVTIGECEGYLRCRGVHVQSARATDSEKHAIEQMLMEGVYVT